MSSNHRSMRKAASIGALVPASLVVAGIFVSAQTSSPVLLVALRVNKSMGALAFIDPVAGKIVGRVPTGQDPHGVAVSADGKTAYVVNTSGPDGNSISVVDVSARKEVRRIELGPGSRPHDILVADGKVYFTAQGYKAIGRFDPVRSTMEWFGLGQQGPHMMTITKDRKTIFAANPNSKTVSVIEGVSGSRADWTVTVIPIGRESEGLDISPDGKEVWLANGEKDGGVTIIDVAGKKVTETIPLHSVHTNRLQLTPDGKRAIVLDREVNEIIVLDAVARQEIKRMKPGAPGESLDVGDVLMAPDASRAYITVFSPTPGGRSYIAVIDMKTLAITSRIDTPIGADEMAWAQTEH